MRQRQFVAGVASEAYRHCNRYSNGDGYCDTYSDGNADSYRYRDADPHSRGGLELVQRL